MAKIHFGFFLKGSYQRSRLIKQMLKKKISVEVHQERLSTGDGRVDQNGEEFGSTKGHI
jgi:hypothetical protein